ncbi:MAG: c-type cytochrome [Mariprofundales bacterium]|nr:c-type cytochrome [Mariprofundales bacterium]
MKKILLLASSLLIASPVYAVSHHTIPDGKALFSANCAVCHGSDGSVSAAGKALKPFPARNLRAIAQVVDREEFRRIITYGIKGTAMSAKKYTLDPLEIDAVISYIKTFTYRPDISNGKKRFHEVCIRCHGFDGRAKTGMGAKNLVRTKLNLKQIVHTMRYGRPGTLMTSKRHQLKNSDINDIAHYVDSLRRLGNPNAGAKIYRQLCIKCHATPHDIKLIGNAAERRKISDLSDQLLDLRIRHGRHVDRAGKKVEELSADEVQDLMAYLRH